MALKKASTRLIFISSLLIFLSILNSIVILIMILNIKNYAEVINLSGRIRGNVQRLEKQILREGSYNIKIKNLEKQIDNYLRELDKKEESFNLLLSQKELSLSKEINKCWTKLKFLLEKEKFEDSYDLSEKCWSIADSITYTYQTLAEKNINYFILLVIFNTLLILLSLLFLLSLLKRDVKDKLEFKAHFDKLTKVLNRHSFEEIFHKFKKNPDNYPLGLIVFDIDNFKQINDIYGHNVGDNVLKEIAKAVKSNLRKEDIFARWGGEEFVLLIKNSDLNKIKYIAEKLRRKIKSLSNSKKFPFPVTVSIGITLIKENEDLEKAIERADKAMYKAKQLGKNRVEVADE